VERLGLAILTQPNSAVDLVITDLIMPGMSGRELTERIHQIIPGLSVMPTAATSCRRTRRAVRAIGRSRSQARDCCVKSGWHWQRAKLVDCFFQFCLTCLMQIESLKVFCDLAETESFTKAAQINAVTQSAVSQQISSLERIFKSLLIERSKKKFRLTREGQVLYDYSKQIIQTYESLHSKLQDLKDIISGTVRVATIYSIGLHDLPPYIKKFMKSYPTVNVHVEYRRANQVYDDVLSNVVDLGLVAYPQKDSKLEIIPLRKEPLVLICHPQHVLAKQKSIKLKSLGGQKIIGFEPDIPTRRALDKILREHSVDVKVVMEFDNVETVKRAVEIDAGISIVPLGTVTQEIAKSTLVAMEIEDGEFYRPLAAIYKKNKVLSPAMKQFLTILKETIN
jgi:DNA-binding transcriptional LysR family regulator